MQIKSKTNGTLQACSGNCGHQIWGNSSSSNLLRNPVKSSWNDILSKSRSPVHMANSFMERGRWKEKRVCVHIPVLPLDWTHSRTHHSIHFQVRMKGRLQTMHVVYSLLMLFKERKKDRKKSWKWVEGVERCINFTYTRQQTKWLLLPQNFFFFSSRKHFPCWIGTY